MKIGIDPGHGGFDPGAVGPARLYEKDVTLGISLYLSKILQDAGWDVMLTRGADVAVSRTKDVNQDLWARTNLLNAAKCDYAISVHVNSATNAGANYISTFIQGKGGQAEKLASKVQPQLVQATGWPDGGVRVQNLHMTRETKMPAILVECGFISNPEQERQLRLPETQKKLARAIADGVLAHLGIENTGGGEMTLDEALKILVDQGVVSGPDYWRNAIGCVKYLDALLINTAKKLQGGK